MDARSSKGELAELRTYYQGQMPALCSARLTVECSSPEIELSIAGNSPACGEELKLAAGTYDLDATLGTQTRRATLELQGNQQITHRVSLEPALMTPPIALPAPPRAEAAPRISTLTKVVAASALITTGSATGVWWVSRRAHDEVRSDYEALGEDRTAEDFERLSASARTRGQRERRAGWSALVLGGVGTLATLGLVVRDARRPGERAMIIGPAGASVWVRF